MDLTPKLRWEDIVTPENYGEWVKVKYRGWRTFYIHSFCRVIKRDRRGEPTKREFWNFIPNRILWLRRCDCCGKLGTPKRINYGYFRFSPDRAGRANYDSRYGEFCISCKNKLRVIQNKSLDFHYTRRLINNYNKEIKNGRKNQNNGAA